MPGGLVQLLTIGTQDAPLILNPEITFFKTIYRRYTNFSLEQIIKTIGSKKFDTFHQFNIPNVNDLLGGFHFVVDIPYFNIVKTVTNIENIYEPSVINELSVIYNDTKTYLFFDPQAGSYYLIPENLYNLSKIDNYFNTISGFDLEKNLLYGKNLLNASNYGVKVDIYQIEDSNFNQLLPAFRLYFNQWYEFWLRIFNEGNSFIYFTDIVSQFYLVTKLSSKLEMIIYDGYINYNVFNKFRYYLNFKDEILNYYNPTSNLIYDTDFAINYANQNNYNIETYKNNAIKFNSLMFLFFLQSLYADFTLKIKGYTFWKKYVTGLFNKVDENVYVSGNNYFLEWKSKINIYQNTSFGNYDSLELQIYESFYKKYFGCEQTIISLMSQLSIKDKEKTWATFKTFYNQMTDNITNILCFEDHFNPNSSQNYLSSKIQDYYQNSYSKLKNIANLESTWVNFDDPNYLQPVDLSMVYPYLTYKFTDAIINEQFFNNHHFFVLWRNKVTIAYYFRLAENLDNWYSEKTNDNTFQNTFLEMNDYGQTYKNLTFYHNINLNRNLKTDILRNDLNNILNVECFYGTINIDNSNLFPKNYIFPAVSYSQIGSSKYNILNQDITITDIDSFNCDLSGNVLSIKDWNRTDYNYIYAGSQGSFLQVYDFNIINNTLLIYLPEAVNLDLQEGTVRLKLIKDLKVPIIDFVPEVDSSGNIDYPNIKINVGDYPDISFNQILLQDLPFKEYNLFNTFDNIVNVNFIIQTDNNSKIINLGDLSENKFFELKVTNSNSTIERNIIRLDSDKNIVPNMHFNFNKITKIDLIEYDFNLNQIATDVPVINFSFNVDISGDVNSFYWLIISKDKSYNVLPKNEFLPVKFNGESFIVFGDPSFYSWDLYEIKTSLVPNLFPILHHYTNTDLSGSIKNYQLNSSFYQQPFILNTYNKYIVKDLSGNLIDANGNLIDQSGNVIDINGNRIIIDENDDVIEYTIDLSNNRITNDGYYIIEDVSGNLNYYDDPDGIGDPITEFGTISYKTGPGIYYKYRTNFEPLYYFYNIPSNRSTTSITINYDYKVNKILPINPSEFYINNNNRYPVVYDPINLNKYYPKELIVNQYSSLFYKTYFQDDNFSYLLETLEKINKLYENLYSDLIKELKNLGKTSLSVIDNSIFINNPNLQNYNSFDFNSLSLFVPDYYDISSNFIATGSAINKFKISNKGIILSQLKQKFKSNQKISNDLTNYLYSVSNTLLNNISYIESNKDLINILNKNQFEQSYQPRYELENIINSNLYDISSYKITTLFDLSGSFTDENTEIYFKNFIIDLSSNQVARGNSLIEISERKTYSTQILAFNPNNFNNDKFNYLGPIYFTAFNVAFLNSYTFINYFNDVFILLDDFSINRLSEIVKNDLQIYYNSYEFTISAPSGYNIKPTLYVYQAQFDISGSLVDLSGNSMIINFTYYEYEKYQDYYIIKGITPLNFDNKYIIYGQSDGSINSFIPINTITISRYIIKANFKTNIYFRASVNQKVIMENGKIYLLDEIIGNNITYYSIYTLETRVQINSIENKYQIPPFKLINQGIEIVNDNKNFFIDSFNKDHYYKFNNNILKGSDFNKINANENFNLWYYPDSNLKLVDTDKFCDISNGYINFNPDSFSLKNYSYYYIDGDVHYIETVTDVYKLNSFIINNKNNKKVYLVDERNFFERDQQYITTIDNSSSERILPYGDLSGNKNFLEDSSILSYYNYNYRKQDEIILDKDFDILVTLKENESTNTVMMPMSFTYDLSNSILPCYLIFNGITYYNFLFYKPSQLIDGFVRGSLFTFNEFATDISCDDLNFEIDQNFNFQFKPYEGLKKLKLLINQGQFYCYIWTLFIDETNYSYDNLYNIVEISGSPFYFPINISINPMINPLMFSINSNYNLLGNNSIIFKNNNFISFRNISTNSKRKQIYYHSNILIKTTLEKLEWNYDSSYELSPELQDLGLIDIPNQNFLSIENPSTDLNYFVLIGNNNSYIRFVTNIDTVNGLVYLNKDLAQASYYIYGGYRKLFFTKNNFNIYYDNTNYYISSFEYNSFRINDIIKFGDNIFKIIGLNSFTMFYDLIPLEISKINTSYPGYYLMYRLNSIPILPPFPGLVDFNINENTNYKLSIDLSENLILSNSLNNFSIEENDEIFLYVNGILIYNVFNYILGNGDYLIYNEQIYRIKFIKEKEIYIIDQAGDIIDLGLNSGFYKFIIPYQPTSLINLKFDASGNMTNNFKNIAYFEYDGVFSTSRINTPNNVIYTRAIEIPQNFYFFQNNVNFPLKGIINNNILTIIDDISDYKLYYQQPIKVNSFISYIKSVDSSGNLILDRKLFDNLDVSVEIYFNKPNQKKLYSNYELVKSCYYKPIRNLGYYHYYGTETDKITNYDISNNLSFFPGTVFEDNVFNLDIDNSMINLNESYHILLEKNKYNQFITHICRLKFPNQLYIYSTVEDYSSDFYLDKIHFIALNNDNTFGFKQSSLVVQYENPGTPYNELIIWKKYDLNLIGLVENLEPDYRVQIDPSNFINEVDITQDFYLDKKVLCTISIDLSNNYYLISNEFFEKFNFIYTKKVNYVVTSVRQEFNELININSNYVKDYNIENVKIPTNLQLVNNVDYYYYALEDDFNIFVNSLNYNFTTGFLNLNVFGNYYDNSLSKRIITTKDEVIDNYFGFFVNNIPSNIFDMDKLFLDSDDSIRNIFNETDFNLSSLFNNLKPWDNWSLVTNPDISKNVLSKGDFILDSSQNVIRDLTVQNYYTFSEVTDISGFLFKIKESYNDFQNLKKFEIEFYKNLSYYIKIEDFWQNPSSYINGLISDLSLNFNFDGKILTLDGSDINKLLLNNQYDLSYNGFNFILKRYPSNIQTELNKFLYNKPDDVMYGVRIDEVLSHLIFLSNELTSFKSYVNTFNGVCNNFADIILYILKLKLYDKNQPDPKINDLQNKLSVDNFSTLGIDLIKNSIMYDSSFNFAIFLGSYPYNPISYLYYTNINFDLNYKIGIKTGLYPYKILLEDETYSDQTIYRLDFLEGENLLNLISIDYPTVYNNQIEFLAKYNFDINHDYSISCYKSYDISSYSFKGFVYQLDVNYDDLNVLDFNSFSSLKYKNMELSIFSNNLVFPEYISTLTSFIQAELLVGVESYDISNNSTYIRLLKLNQTLNPTSENYTLYFQSDNKNFRVDDLYNKEIRIRGILDTIKNTKLILTIKPTLATNTETILFNLVITKPLTNYSYYFDLTNILKNFLINNEIKCQDIEFIGDTEMNVLVNNTDASSNLKISSVFHYSKVGEYPPEPIQKLTKGSSYVYQFNDIPYIKDKTSCFIKYDTNYNKTNSTSYINNFILTFPTKTYDSSIDVFKFDTYTQFLCNKYINQTEIHEHVFGGVINSWTVYQYTWINKILRFKPDLDFIYDSRYNYYINNFIIDKNTVVYGSSDEYFNKGFIEMTVNIDLSGGGNLLFRQLIIENEINIPNNNQLAELTVSDPLDIKFDGYIQTLDENEQEIGNYIYKLSVDLSDNLFTDSTIYFNSNIITEGKVLLSKPLYVITNQLLSNITSVYIRETNTYISNFTVTFIQSSFVPFTLYKKLELGKYLVFLNSNNLNFMDEYFFSNFSLNRFFVATKFAKFKLNKRYDSQILAPNPELLDISYNKIITTQSIEKSNFVKDLHKHLFQNIDFYIGDQLVEQINPDVFDIQYQFLKDSSRRIQYDKLVKPIITKNGIKMIIPLEFWFTGYPSLYLPIICLKYTLLSLQMKINNINNLITNGPLNSTNNIKYKFSNTPDINIELNIDGILLDTNERELFGNNSHEYIVEVFKTYPDSLISKTEDVSRMKFKNLVKDLFFQTKILSTNDKTYKSYKLQTDKFTTEYLFKKDKYNEYLKIGVFNDEIKIEYSIDFDYLKKAQLEISTKSGRYNSFNASVVLSKNNMEQVLYMDSKYQKNITSINKRILNLEVYFIKVYKNYNLVNNISPIKTMNLKTSGIDLFRAMEQEYFNLVVPYQKYHNSIDLGFYGYSFAIYPNEKQPSGHINFTTLDDIVVNTTSDSRVREDPYILKTSVREYQIIRIMSGMGALAFIN
jgi:hypothetical protein